MNKNVLVVCATVIVIALLFGAVFLSTGGRMISTNFMTLAGLVLVNVVLALLNLARTEQVSNHVGQVSDHVDQVSNQVNGRFIAQQEITMKALDVIPPDVAAMITKDALNPPPDGSPEVESQPQVSPRPDQPGSVTN